MPSPTLGTTWRLLEARVHLALSPTQLLDPATSATQAAFEKLLMRYNHSLKGVVVANVGPLKLLTKPTFIDASPFAHVVGRISLLLFNPPAGSVLVGVINYIGPDHIALRVFRTFHAVLPLHDVANMFQFDASYPKKWTRYDEHAAPENDLTLGRQVRFIVQDTKATKEGLFQIMASLDNRVCDRAVEPGSLGLIAPGEEIPGQFVPSPQEEVHEDSDAPSFDVLNVTKNSKIHRSRRDPQRDADQLLLGGDSSFGDVLAPAKPGLLSIKQNQSNDSRRDSQTQRFGTTAGSLYGNKEFPSNCIDAGVHQRFADEGDDDDDDDEESEQNQSNVQRWPELEDIRSEGAKKAHLTPTQEVTGDVDKRKHEKKNIAVDGKPEGTEGPVRPISKQKEELKLVNEVPMERTKSQHSERSEEKSEDKARKSKHDKKKKKRKEEKEKHGTPTAKRKKKRRNSDSLLERQKVEPVVESEKVHLGLTEVKKRKKSKEKEKRKEKETQKSKHTDIEKKKVKKRKRREHDLTESYRESQQSEIRTQSSLQATASSQNSKAVQKQAGNTVVMMESGDKRGDEKPFPRNEVISTKYETALLAVNLAPLISQGSAETKSEPVKDGLIQFRTQAHGKVHQIVNDVEDVPVKTQTEDAEKDGEKREAKLEGLDGGEGTTDPIFKTKKHAKEEATEGSPRERSDKKRKKRKRERNEDGGSERKKKKKSRHRHEAAGQKEEAEVVGPGETAKGSALAKAISESLVRRWQAR